VKRNDSYCWNRISFMRRFYLEYNDSPPQIQQTVYAKFVALVGPETPIRQTGSDQFRGYRTLSWSHLVLGKGFFIEARQKRFTFDADHSSVDLVFYNRIFRCYVLVDLKMKITHADIGQMQWMNVKAGGEFHIPALLY